MMVNVLLPLEVTVTVLVAVLPVVTLPKESDVGLTVMAAADAGFSCTVNVLVVLLSEAVSFTALEAVTAETVAEKLALVAPAATVTDAGTVIALLLLESATVNPGWLAAAVSVTVQLSVPAPVIELLLQLRLLRLPLFFNCPCPFRCTVFDPACLLSLVSVIVPVAVPVEVGENATPMEVDWLG